MPTDFSVLQMKIWRFLGQKYKQHMEDKNKEVKEGRNKIRFLSYHELGLSIGL